MTTPPPPTAQHGVTLTRKPGMRTTDKLLAGILAALVLLIAAVVALSVVLYVSTRPVPAPTGASRHVTVTVLANSAIVDVVLTDPSGISTVRLEGGATTLDSTSWDRDVPFGQAIEVTTTMTGLGTDDEGNETISGMVTCKILDGTRTLATSSLDVVGGRSACRWVNDGR